MGQLNQADKFNQEYFDKTFDSVVVLDEEHAGKGVPKDEIVKLLNYLVTGGMWPHYFC